MVKSVHIDLDLVTDSFEIYRNFQLLSDRDILAVVQGQLRYFDPPKMGIDGLLRYFTERDFGWIKMGILGKSRMNQSVTNSVDLYQVIERFIRDLPKILIFIEPKYLSCH